MNKPLGIVVRSEPYTKFAGREILDPALAAASLELPLRVFFIGDGLLHLLPDQQPASINVVAYTRGWAALWHLSDSVELYAEEGAVKRPELPNLRLVNMDKLATAMAECKAVIHV